jgi:hypothetical protein
LTSQPGFLRLGFRSREPIKYRFCGNKKTVKITGLVLARTKMQLKNNPTWSRRRVINHHLFKRKYTNSCFGVVDANTAPNVGCVPVEGILLGCRTIIKISNSWSIPVKLNWLFWNLYEATF